MFLKPIEVGDGFVISKLNDKTYWDGWRFVNDIASAKEYSSLWEAMKAIPEIIEQQYEPIQKQSYIVPVTIEATGNVTRKEIGEYLQAAAKLFVDRDEFGNGPSADSYVEPKIHWHLIKDLSDGLDEDPDDPYSSWGYGLDIDDL